MGKSRSSPLAKGRGSGYTLKLRNFVQVVGGWVNKTATRMGRTHPPTTKPGRSEQTSQCVQRVQRSLEFVSNGFKNKKVKVVHANIPEYLRSLKRRQRSRNRKGFDSGKLFAVQFPNQTGKSKQSTGRFGKLNFVQFTKLGFVCTRNKKGCTSPSSVSRSV